MELNPDSDPNSFSWKDFQASLQEDDVQEEEQPVVTKPKRRVRRKPTEEELEKQRQRKAAAEERRKAMLADRRKRKEEMMKKRKQQQDLPTEIVGFSTDSNNTSDNTPITVDATPEPEPVEEVATETVGETFSSTDVAESPSKKLSGGEIITDSGEKIPSWSDFQKMVADEGPVEEEPVKVVAPKVIKHELTDEQKEKIAQKKREAAARRKKMMADRRRRKKELAAAKASNNEEISISVAGTEPTPTPTPTPTVTTTDTDGSIDVVDSSSTPSEPESVVPDSDDVVKSVSVTNDDTEEVRKVLQGLEKRERDLEVSIKEKENRLARLSTQEDTSISRRNVESDFNDNYKSSYTEHQLSEFKQDLANQFIKAIAGYDDALMDYQRQQNHELFENLTKENENLKRKCKNLETKYDRTLAELDVTVQNHQRDYSKLEVLEAKTISMELQLEKKNVEIRELTKLCEEMLVKLESM
eukprot:TRINITY_DN7487_c3_g1_i1.p1 TRINITY_DN7487_c3_g1~~TRINITY_DN7487_c3_g1_i1.p1  ORF type:complete len:471 (+),score=181.77 TRINITY_DN7487_c3_g1_i1:33-1445(+)